MDLYARVLRNLKEELACATDKWLWIININNISYSYIPLQVGYHCYYTSPRRSRGQVLITMISYEYSGI